MPFINYVAYNLLRLAFFAQHNFSSVRCKKIYIYIYIFENISSSNSCYNGSSFYSDSFILTNILFKFAWGSIVCLVCISILLSFFKYLACLYAFWGGRFKFSRVFVLFVVIGVHLQKYLYFSGCHRPVIIALYSTFPLRVHSLGRINASFDRFKLKPF